MPYAPPPEQVWRAHAVKARNDAARLEARAARHRAHADLLDAKYDEWVAKQKKKAK